MHPNPISTTQFHNDKDTTTPIDKEKQKNMVPFKKKKGGDNTYTYHSQHPRTQNGVCDIQTRAPNRPRHLSRPTMQMINLRRIFLIPIRGGECRVTAERSLACGAHDVVVADVGGGGGGGGSSGKER
jgi:hypothetical protein